MSYSRGCQGLEGTRGLLLRVARYLRLGLRLSLLGVVYEPTGVLDVLTVCRTSKVVGHVSRSLSLAKS